MKIERVECTSVRKGNQQGYVLRVTTPEEDYDIVRTDGTFFDFKADAHHIASLDKKKKDKLIITQEVYLMIVACLQLSKGTPCADGAGFKWCHKFWCHKHFIVETIRSLTWFNRLKGGEKKKKQITDFCKAILGLPEEISQGEYVQKFFEKWPSDSCEAAINDIKEEERRKSSSSSGGDHNKHKKLIKQASHEHPVSGNPNLMAELKKTMTEGTSKRASAGAKLPETKKDVKSNHPAKVLTPLNKDPLERTRSEEGPETSLSKYVVIADHKPGQHDELELTTGDVIFVVEKTFLGWWLAQHAETEGWAPAAKLQALDEKEDQEDQADAQSDTADICPVYEAISDFVAKNDDEVSYMKKQKVEVLKMQNDGWWKVRSKDTGKVGMAPAVNLARLSDGSQSGDPLYDDISAYSHQSVYKKRTPPRRNSSHRMSLSELYAKVEIKSRPKPPTAQKKIPEMAEYDDDTLYSTNRPAVPPKKLGLSKLNYSEIAFSEPESQNKSSPTKAAPPKFKVRAKENNVTYSDIEIAPLPPKPKPDDQHVYGNIKPSNPQEGYMNVVRVGSGEAGPPDKYCRLTQDYSPKMTHYEGLPANKDDIVKILKDDDLTNAFCLMCLKEKEESKPSEGWIPKEYLAEVKVEVLGHDEHDVPMVSVLEDSGQNGDDENLYLTVVCSVKDPRKPGWRNKDYRKADWFAGTLNRAECEVTMKEAKDGQFLVREKADEAEPFSISVFYKGGLKHFKIVKKEENRYELGGHSFKNLSHIIRHYTKYPLFLGKDNKEEKLGKPFVIPKQNGQAKRSKSDS